MDKILKELDRYVFKIIDLDTNKWLTNSLEWGEEGHVWNKYVYARDALNSAFEKKDIPDSIKLYAYEKYEYLTDEEIELLIEKNPLQAKKWLARQLVAQFHGIDATIKAENDWNKIHVKKEIPDDIPLIEIDKEPDEDGIVRMNIVDLIHHCDPSMSKSDIRRMIKSGGVKIYE